MRDVAGLAILAATAVVPVGVARVVLGALFSQLSRLRSSQTKANTPAAEPRPVVVPVSLEAR